MFKKPRTLEELIPHDREFCVVLTSLGAVFNTVLLIKHEYDVEGLKGYIGFVFTLPCMVVPVIVLLCLHTLPLDIRMFSPCSGFLTSCIPKFVRRDGSK